MYYDATITDSEEFLDDACEGFATHLQDLAEALADRDLRGVERCMEDMQDALDAIQTRYAELVETEESEDEDDDPE